MRCWNVELGNAKRARMFAGAQADIPFRSRSVASKGVLKHSEV